MKFEPKDRVSVAALTTLFFAFSLSWGLVGCGKDEPSSHRDNDRAGESASGSNAGGEASVGSPYLAKRRGDAMRILSAQCLNCHSKQSRGGWSENDADSKWVERGLVTAGDAEGSKLMQSLKNFGGAMPKNAPALDEEAVTVLRVWIENLNQPKMDVLRIRKGTAEAKQPWNTKQTAVRLQCHHDAAQSDQLKIINEDTESHRVHTLGAPFPHEFSDTRIGAGEAKVFRMQRPVDTVSAPDAEPSVYCHEHGTAERLFIVVTAAEGSTANCR